MGFLLCLHYQASILRHLETILCVREWRLESTKKEKEREKHAHTHFSQFLDSWWKFLLAKAKDIYGIYVFGSSWLICGFRWSKKDVLSLNILCLENMVKYETHMYPELLYSAKHFGVGELSFVLKFAFPSFHALFSF